MAEFGHFALKLSLFLCGYAILIDILGIWLKRTDLNKSASNATIASFGCLTITILVLWILIFKADFSIKYVAEYTSRTLPFLYKLSSLWAGAAGSLLLWLWIQVGFAIFVFKQGNRDNISFFAHGRAIINLVSLFFLLILLFDKNPFALSDAEISDGTGLNPLLQHPAMALHPPTLFIGYAAFIIPFAWAFALLKWDDSRGNAPMLKQVRTLSLVAWLFLTIGIALGAWWAYEELGWGGYWAWDAVENSSLMPWLTATALIHCFINYKRNSSVSKWLIILCLVTYGLCVFGTFLTRYGLVSSVHAFPDPGLGILFIILLLILFVIAVILALVKLKNTISRPLPIKSQKFIILNSWLMILLMLVIFIGTLFPFFSGLLNEEQIVLQPDYFTKITAPFAFVLLLLLGICPYLIRYGLNKSWRIIGAVFSAISAIIVWIVVDKIAIVVFILCAFAAMNLAGDFINRVLNKMSINNKVINLRWYGARIVHIGVIMVFIGMAGSGGFSSEDQVTLEINQEVSSAGYNFIFNGFTTDHGPNYTAAIAEITVNKDGNLYANLNPSLAFYTDSQQRTSEVDIKRTLLGDLYLALNQADLEDNLINLNIMVKPLINWIWIGCSVSILGTIIVLVSSFRKSSRILKDEGIMNNE